VRSGTRLGGENKQVKDSLEKTGVGELPSKKRGLGVCKEHVFTG